MSFELRQLRYAIAAADMRSFARAASAMNVKQATLSRRVTDLEHSLGLKLFERTTRGALPTINGSAFIEQTRRLVTDAENLQTTARNVSYGLHGRLAIGYCSPLLSGNLKLAFAEYLSRFPDVQFNGIEAAPEKLLQGLQSRTIDVAIAPIGLDDTSVSSRPLWSERLFAVLLEDHRLLMVCVARRRGSDRAVGMARSAVRIRNCTGRGPWAPSRPSADSRTNIRALFRRRRSYSAATCAGATAAAIA